jgi:hypothetical protein
LLTNARCLSEGVDVTSLDGVAFIDPRSSQIEIIQAVGRAIRLSENKKAGTIVLPVFISKSEDPEQALEEGSFKPIWDVLNALKAHDEVLANELDEMRVALGRMGKSKAKLEFNKIKIDLPITVDQSFGNLLSTFLVEKVTNSWFYAFGYLKEYSEKNGSTTMPENSKTENGYAIGIWTSKQRQARDKLSKEQIEMLESLKGWTWDPKGDKWNTAFNQLVKYLSKNENSAMSPKFVDEDGFLLGRWVSTQRSRTDLNDDQQKRLNSLKGFLWDIDEHIWNESYKDLKDFAEKYGHCDVPKTVRMQNGKKLWFWREKQYLRPNREKLTEEQKKKLEALPGWSWSSIAILRKKK